MHQATLQRQQSVCMPSSFTQMQRAATRRPSQAAERAGGFHLKTRAPTVCMHGFDAHHSRILCTYTPHARTAHMLHPKSPRPLLLLPLYCSQHPTPPHPTPLCRVARAGTNAISHKPKNATEPSRTVQIIAPPAMWMAAVPSQSSPRARATTAQRHPCVGRRHHHHRHDHHAPSCRCSTAS